MLQQRKKLLIGIAGTFLYAAGINLFIVPAGMYSGGFLGISQIVRTLLVIGFDLDLESIDIAGILHYFFNIPLFLLAYQKIGKRFFESTVFIVTVQTMFLTVIPANIELLQGDPLTSSIIGGIFVGYGGGLVLREGASGGGQEILGVYMMKRDNSFSVGKIAILINAVVYIGCLVLYNISIVIYSLVYVVVSCLVMDRVHLQNVNMKVVIITDKEDAVEHIIDHYRRSATVLNGKGGYSGKKYRIIYTVMSKYEAKALGEELRKKDPDAFIVFSEVTHVQGNFEKHV